MDDLFRVKGLDTSALESDPSVIFALDATLRITYCNRAWDDFALQNSGREVRRDAVCGRPIREFLNGSVAAFYLAAYDRVLETQRAWRHEFECSSAEKLRRFAMHVYPLDEGSGILVMNSLRVDMVHDRECAAPLESEYRNLHGLIVMCSNCRRTRRNGGAEMWDWVPEFVSTTPPKVSHGLCLPCSEHYELSFQSF
jgi:PAS domain-containing protein